MQLYMSWYIRSFFGFAFLNILYFFKYSCTNIFHGRSLYTFYEQAVHEYMASLVSCFMNRQTFVVSFEVLCFIHTHLPWLNEIQAIKTLKSTVINAVFIKWHGDITWHEMCRTVLRKTYDSLGMFVSVCEWDCVGHAWNGGISDEYDLWHIS